MPALSPATVSSLQTRILRWYRSHQRVLRWRRTRDPYHILVSEIMLQQTQVKRVEEKLPPFLSQFPTLRSLGEASAAQVIRAWRGMGYNNRAVRLRDLAREVTKSHNGKIPDALPELMDLPGIGPYTASAVACFAYGAAVPVVDVNVERVLSRLFGRLKRQSQHKNNKELFDLARTVLPKDAYSWNQSLMDLGSLVCTPRNPSCGECPVKALCASRHLYTASDANIARGTRPHRRPEPTYDGVPRRIWRGRIVEALRNVNGRGSLPVLQLGRNIKGDFRPEETQWLLGIISGLEKDRIVVTRGRHSSTKIRLNHA